MSNRKISADPTRRHKTRNRGISYRERRDGTRTYSIYWQGNYVAVEGGENEAVAKRAELLHKAANGEAIVKTTKLTFEAVAEEWLASKQRLRPYTRKNYRATLDRILIPRFGSKKIAGITTEDVAALIRDGSSFDRIAVEHPDEVIETSLAFVGEDVRAVDVAPEIQDALGR